MSRCPTIISNFAKEPKTHSRHIRTKDSLKITLWNRHFTLTYVYVKYETIISSWYI